MANVATLIAHIERLQPVLNKGLLSESDLAKTPKKVMDLAQADADSVAFLSSAKYAKSLQETQAGVILLGEQFAKLAPKSAIVLVVKDAYLAYATISTLFAYEPCGDIHPTAVIDDGAIIGKGVSIGAYSVIGKGVQIGDDCVIGSGCTIEDFAVLGKSCHLANQVNIAHHSVLGDDVRIHAHASIGSEGFGFAPNPTAQGLSWQRIAQIGCVRIGNRVRIGSNTCIDRGAVGDTVIGDDVIIDNLVQIAHNVHIGNGTAIAATTGIAGSTHIGKNCIIGGGVGIAGHLTIADGVTLTGRTFVTKSIAQAGSYSSGTTAMPSQDWRRATVKFRQSGEK